MKKDLSESAGYISKHRLDLVTSDDTNFRPVDMEFAPDGSLYLIDWHNVLVGICSTMPVIHYVIMFMAEYIE